MCKKIKKKYNLNSHVGASSLVSIFTCDIKNVFFRKLMCEHKISLILFDEEMTCGLSIFTYPVFGPGRASTEGITRPIKITA
jgi:hypothetical protein